MKITSLKLTNFRNIESAHLQLDNAPIVALYGENGAGKTSILEAISLLSPGSGMHRHKLDDHIKHHEKTWALHSNINNKDEENTVGMLYQKGKRQLKINGEAAKAQAELSNLGNILWFTPKMDRLFMDSASQRREFLDRLAFGHFPQHAQHLNRYKHHLKARLKLLKENAATTWIDIEEEQASHFAFLISQSRNHYLKMLKTHLDAIDLKLTGSFERMEKVDKKSIQEKLYENRTRDGRFGSSHFGPHRSDVEGILQPENINLSQTSTGQHKRAILEILLANSRLTHQQTGEAPIILLDEMAAHLDSQTKERFFSALIQLGSQIWLTGTEKEMFTSLQNVQFFCACDGSFKKDID
tara:strand:+ start:91545 stop:92609 length:1065 start_codon:yes stop_codon:yes gene_type:complete